MLKMRFSKKRTKEIMKNTNLIKGNKRLKDELDEIIGRDELYTPKNVGGYEYGGSKIK